jgi:hypothetical protein
MPFSASQRGRYSPAILPEGHQVLGALAAILPARRAARLKVIEALSYE